ncbi:hypothetical protein HD554DRAFT_2022989 [Boletus coccyginus]|nr:hypothetical protein HD554DRAFT_2022989 [Boletus coccyginus]
MSTPSVSFSPPPAVLSKQWDAGQDPTFAFARLQRDVCLTVDPSGTPLLDLHVFRHEFASIFRYSHSACVHPLEVRLRLLEPLDDNAGIRYEPDSGTVFLAKDLMAHLKRILDATAMFNRTSRHSMPPRQRS